MDKKTIAWACLAVTILILGSDYFLGVDDVEGNTYSSIVTGYSRYVLGIPLFFGSLMAHWFFPSAAFKNTLWRTYGTMVGLMVASSAVGWFLPPEHSNWYMLGAFIIGAVHGRLFWSNREVA